MIRSIFTRSISPRHSERDYDNEITSSRDDVMTSMYNDPKLDPTKFQRTTTRRAAVAAIMAKRNSLLKTLVRQRTLEEREEDFIKVPDKANFKVHQKHITYCKTSLNFFTENSKIRQACVWFTEWKYTEHIVVAVVIINSVLLGLIDYRDGQENAINKLMVIINPIFVGLYALEALVKIIAMGFNQEEGTYLRNLQNVIDFFVVISGLSFGYKPLEHFSILRLPRVFLIIKDFNFFQTAVVMFTTISKSMWQFLSVIVLMVFVFGLFAILGLNIYIGVLDWRCRTTSAPVNGTWPVDNSLLLVCGGQFQCPVGEYCGSDYQYQDQLAGNIGNELFYSEFDWGLMNFDNILNSMANIFVLMSMVGWSNIFDMVVDATDKITALLFFVLTIVIILAFTINLVVAIIVDQLSRQKCNELTKAPSRTLSIVKSNAQTIFIPVKSTGRFSFRGFIAYVENRYMYAKHTPGSDYYKNPIVYYFHRFIFHKLTQDFNILLIVANTVVLCLNRYPINSESELHGLVISNQVLTYIYLGEMTMKLMALGFLEFVRKKTNVFEIVIAIASTIELNMRHSFSAISAFRIFRILQLLRPAKSKHKKNSEKSHQAEKFRLLVDTVFEGYACMIDYILILGVFIYIFAIIGMKFFAGKLTFDAEGHYDANGTPPTQNFDTLKDAFSTTFSLLFGQNWLNVFFSCQISLGWSTFVYFVIVILVGRILFIQLYIALIIIIFEEARNKLHENKSSTLIQSRTQLNEYERKDTEAHLQDEEAKVPTETGRSLWNIDNISREGTMARDDGLGMKGVGRTSFRRESTMRRGMTARPDVDVSVSKSMEQQPDDQPPQFTEQQFVTTNRTFPEENVKELRARESIVSLPSTRFSNESRWTQCV